LGTTKNDKHANLLLALIT